MRLRYVLQGLVFIFSVIFALDVFPVLRGCCGWQWEHHIPPEILPVLPLGFVLLIYITGVFLIPVALSKVRLLWSIIGTIAITIAHLFVHGSPLHALFSRTTSPVYTGSMTASVYELGDNVPVALYNWPDVMVKLAGTSNIHVALSPPGQPLIHRWLTDLFEYVPFLSEFLSASLRPLACNNISIMLYTRSELASTAFGIFMPLWVSLGTLLIYQLVVLLSGHQVASRVVMWYPLIPGLHYFTPTWNTLYPVLILAMMWLLAYVWVGKRWRISAFLAGCIMSCLTFLNLSVIPAIMIAGWFTLLAWFLIDRQRNDTTILLPVQIGFWYGLGLLSVWIIYGLYSGVTPLDIIETALNQHLDIERDYFIWVFLHTYDTLLFAGLSLAGIALYHLTQLRQKEIDLADIMLVATYLSLLIMVLSGTARGETGRVWLFFAPLLLVGSADLHQKLHSSWIIVQAIMVFVLLVFLQPMNTFLDPVPDEPDQDIGQLGGLEYIPLDLVFTSEEFQGEIVLDQYAFVGDPSLQIITFEFVWRGISPTERPYQLVLDAMATNSIDGEILVEPQFFYPQSETYPSTCWQADQIIRQILHFELPPVSEPVVWDVSLRVISPRLDDVMQITTPTGEVSNRFDLVPVRYP